MMNPTRSANNRRQQTIYDRFEKDRFELEIKPIVALLKMAEKLSAFIGIRKKHIVSNLTVKTTSFLNWSEKQIEIEINITRNIHINNNKKNTSETSIEPGKKATAGWNITYLILSGYVFNIRHIPSI